MQSVRSDESEINSLLPRNVLRSIYFSELRFRKESADVKCTKTILRVALGSICVAFSRMSFHLLRRIRVSINRHEQFGKVAVLLKVGIVAYLLLSEY